MSPESLSDLDLVAEDRFDRITHVVARTFGVPHAAVALDHVPVGDHLVVEDLSAHAAFAQHPQVAGPPHARFYAGVAVRSPCGEVAGTLFIADTEPRTFGPGDVELLADLAGWVEHELAGGEVGEALRARGESEQRLNAVMATVPDGVVSFGEDGVIASVNPAAAHMFGMPPGLLIGARVDTLLHRLKWDELQRLLRDGPDSIIGRRLEVTGRRSDFSPFPLELTVGRTRVRGRSLYVAVGRDVTERRAAEDALQRVVLQNELLLESAGDGILGLDRTGKVTFVNPAAAEMLRCYAFELIGRPMHEAVRIIVDGAPLTFEESAPYVTMRDGRTRRKERIITRDDGSTFPAELTVAATRATDDITGAVVTIRDVSERYEVDRMKDEFVSVVGHELRTPLTSIRGSLGLLAGGVLGDLSPQAERMLSIAISNTDRLVRLINDILDIERMQAGRLVLKLEPQPARDLLAATVDVVGATAEGKGVTLRVEADDVAVVADHDRLVQALTNLAGNAVKFSPPDGEVLLSARADGADVRFEVRDHGRGIPPEDLERIFNRFEQVDASDARERGGTGLGLPIARSIVDQHGGRIWAESRPGEGAAFVITLPLLELEDEESEPPTVLVTGGDEPERAALGALLARAGYRPATIADPGPFTAVLVAGDPVESAGALSALRARSQTAGVPLVFVGRQGEEELVEALARAVPTLERHRVLVVEDDPDLGRVLARMLERHGTRVALARTAQQALEQLDRQPPDVLLLDLVLPEGDGFAVVDRLREDARLASTPLVVYTAVELDGAERERLQLGRTKIMTKGRATPADVEEHVTRLLDAVASPT